MSCARARASKECSIRGRVVCVVCWAAADALARVRAHAVAICVRVRCVRALGRSPIGPIRASESAQNMQARDVVGGARANAPHPARLGAYLRAIFCVCVVAHNSAQVLVWNVHFILIKWGLCARARMCRRMCGLWPIRPFPLSAALCACSSF